VSFDAYFYTPFAAARAYVFSRIFLVMVALDAWTLMIGHAGRYGVDGFNVAHFGWLDAILPPPSAAVYIGVLLATGLLALALAIGGIRRIALGCLFLLYTLSWSMSMLDSYQHHYFVSSVLLCLVFFPMVRASDVHPPPSAAAALPERTDARKNKAKSKPKSKPATRRSQRPEPNLAQGFGFNLLGATAGILYVYTAIAKMDAGWRDGHTITRISAAKRVFAPLATFAGELGISDDTFWSLFATSVIPIELTIALTYFIAVRADVAPSRWPRRIALAGWFLAMMLHVGAEAMELEIGWFSYYMMLFACAFLLPARGIDRVAALLTVPSNFLRTQLADILAPATNARPWQGTLAISAAVALMLGAVGRQIDLPGALPACLLAAAALVLAAAAASGRGRALDARAFALGAGAAAALMWLSIATSEARFDFYRFLGGDLRRRGDPSGALEAYERGERYAPKGRSRKDQIEQLRRELGR
jgi:hypothetical protein